ncbi:sulfate adenylyltransferase [Corticibacter populi]|uniref:Sulfate adenylyltransferase n=1 Tax=Corticibacter populi TaxID=1550736 RepID=A0A3M6QK06_9BURK|nr:GTP-binding protein [Corticibacter populi]RMX03434.1 sulfate adenylyltransferase [Corticibacter populi]RZS29869.1 sulfate adenylyltransferase subunit 1 [Corticibacter populi]
MSTDQPKAALRFITCGSVDDGKSTLIGRLLVDSKSVLQDQLAGITRHSAASKEEIDLAQLTDGLAAEREQGITIDVAWRYFSTAARKFIIGDAPGHEQYTRNMVTAASNADAAVVLIDATKLDWQNPALQLLPQTKRHSLLAHLLRVPSLIFAVNKLDAVADPAQAFANIRAALQRFTDAEGLQPTAIVPISALKGYNVVDTEPGFAGYDGPALLPLLEALPTTPADTTLPLALPVQWVEKFSSSADTSKSRRIFWGRVATGRLQAGQEVRVFPSGQAARVVEVLDHARQPVGATGLHAGTSAGVALDRELDISRGDWLLAAEAPAATTGADDDFDDFDTLAAPAHAWPGRREITATIAWMDDEPAALGRVYWALHGHRWVKAKIRRIVQRLNIHTLEREAAETLEPNALGTVELVLQEAIPAAPFGQSRSLGALILVDTASHKTAAAVLVNH